MLDVDARAPPLPSLIGECRFAPSRVTRSGSCAPAVCSPRRPHPEIPIPGPRTQGFRIASIRAGGCGARKPDSPIAADLVEESRSKDPIGASAGGETDALSIRDFFDFSRRDQEIKRLFAAQVVA